jgi:hypothetical protein
MKTKQATPYPLRLPPEITEWVKAKAKEEHRSFNSQITHMLEKLKETQP